MRLSKGEKWVYAVFLIVLVMVNPPVVNLVSRCAEIHPFLWGWPTLLVWLDGWYCLAMGAFLVGALFIRSWKRDYQEPKEDQEVRS